MYEPIPLPPCVGPRPQAADIIAGIRRWALSPAMRDLVTGFGGRPPADTDLAAVLRELADFSAAHWDFRGGAERAQARRKVFDPPLDTLINEAADSLGLVNRSTAGGHYTHVLVLGGLIRACLARTGFAARLLNGAVTATEVSAVGGFRPMTAPEHEFAAALGITDCHFEVDAMAEGLRRAFPITGTMGVEAGGDPEIDPNRAWRVHGYTAGDSLNVRAVAAPSSDPNRRRANTPDTCRFWAERVVKLQSHHSVLVVTSSMFVPFQHCDAVTNIGFPYGCGVDTVGVNMSTLSDPLFRQSGSTDRQLQEIRSAVLSMQRLYAAVTA